MEFEELKARIGGSLNNVSSRRRLAAQYLLQHPGEVAVLSLRKVASLARVSPATFIKLAKDYGFDSYNDLKAVYQNKVVRETDYFSSGVREFQSWKSACNQNNLTLQVVEADLGNVQNTFSGDVGNQVARAAEMLTVARRIYVIGMRACYSIAHYISYSLSLFRDNVYLINDNGGLMGEAILRMDSSDVLLATGFYPYVRQTVTAVKHAERIGTKVISITDSKKSPLNSRTGETFLFSNNSPWIFGSITSAVVLSQCLVANMVALGGADVLSEITTTEKHLNNLKVFAK